MVVSELAKACGADEVTRIGNKRKFESMGTKIVQKKLTFLSMFCGCGGMDEGFRQAGFECVWANDFDKDACDTYALNFGEKHLHRGDIDAVKTPAKKSVKNLTVLLGGFPCQAFSNAGQRKGVEDKRGNLYRYCIEYAERYSPKFVVFENVRGLLTIPGKEKLLIEEILDELERIGYISHIKLLEASNYGVPQRRIRVFIVARRKSLGINYRFPSLKPDKSKLTLKNILSVPTHVKNQTQVIRLNPQAHILGDQVPEGGSWKDIPYENLPERLKKIRDNMRKYRWPNFYRRFSREEIAGTITAAFKPENAGVWHPTKLRPFSVREIARIQSFPDSFRFTGSSVKSIYQMIGNAVPPLLAKEIALSILASLSKPIDNGEFQDYHTARKNLSPMRPEDPELVYDSSFQDPQLEFNDVSI